MSADAYNMLGLGLGIVASRALAYPILWALPETESAGLRRHQGGPRGADLEDDRVSETLGIALTR
jgi:hypothetical protein